jgi:hypothetical protein
MPVRAEIAADLPLIYTREEEPLSSPLMPHSSMYRGIEANFMAPRACCCYYLPAIQSSNWDINSTFR